MAIATATRDAVEAISERLTPALESIEETMREGRRAINRGQRAAEDAVDAATAKIRRRPMSAVMIAAGAGAIAGGLLGAWLSRRR